MFSNYLDKKYLEYLSILCSLVVPLLVLGPFLPDLIISLSSLWLIYFIFKNKLFHLFQNKFFYIFIFFWFFFIISSLLSENVLVSLKSSVPLIRFALFAILISCLIDSETKIYHYFYLSILFTFIVLIFDGFFQYFNGFNLIGLKIDESKRVSSFFGSELILGSYLTKIYPLFLAIFLSKKKTYIELVTGFLIFILIDILIFVSGDRAAFASFNLITVFILVLISNYKIYRGIAFVISTLLIICIINFNESLKVRYIDEPIRKMNINLKKNSEKKYFATPAHDSLVRTAFNMFLDKPIFGHGPKMFRFKCANKKYAHNNLSCNNHPHNYYIQLLAETGIMGFIYIFSIFLYVLFISIYHLKKKYFNKEILLSDYQICLFAGIISFVWPLITTGNIFNNNVLITSLLILGFFRKEFKKI